MKTRRATFVDDALLERGLAFNTHLFGFARALLRMAEENGKPNAERLREYRESNRASLEQALFSPAPIYDRFETAKLADSLAMYMELKGADDELVRKVMAGKSPSQRAAELIAGTKLKDVAVRKQLAAGGAKALAAAQDPMIELARTVDAAARKFRKTGEELGEAMQQSYAKLAKARFALEGTNVYPDATFTLRLAFGVVEGYMEGGERIPPWTTLGGAYHHAEAHGGRSPYALPKRWLDRKDRLDLRHALELPLHGRHHRRQFRQPGGQSRRRAGRSDLRRQPPFVGLGFCLRRQPGPRHRRGRPGHPGGPPPGLRRRRAGQRTGEIRRRAEGEGRSEPPGLSPAGLSSSADPPAALLDRRGNHASGSWYPAEGQTRLSAPRFPVIITVCTSLFGPMVLAVAGSLRP